MIALDDAWGASRTRQLAEQVAESPTPRQAIGRIEASLGEPPALDRVEQALAWLVENRGRVPVQDLADSASLSPRQFRRICLERTGLTPKRLARVLRFRRALAHTGQERATDWAQVALDCGYYDQAHLIIEFLEFSDLAPGEFAASLHSSNFAAPALSLAE
jgi:transcriptional regulator GlxA family with amidase domain